MSKFFKALEQAKRDRSLGTEAPAEPVRLTEAPAEPERPVELTAAELPRPRPVAPQESSAVLEILLVDDEPSIVDGLRDRGRAPSHAPESKDRRDRDAELDRADQVECDGCRGNVVAADRDEKQAGDILPVVITVFKDKSFTFVTKSPPAAILLKKAANIAAGSWWTSTNSIPTLSTAPTIAMLLPPPGMP